jgi:F-type H+-transporting ATPase subunit alpha
VEKQIAIIFAGTNGFLDELEVNECRLFEQSFYRFLDTSQAGLLAKIREKKALDDELRGQLTAVLKEAKEKFKAEKGRAA